MIPGSPQRYLPLLAALSVPLPACSDIGPRVYIAEPYDAEAECLGEYEAIGLVQAGDLPATCPAVCLELGGTLYVSTVCPPFPDYATELDPIDDPTCAAALTAEACAAADSP